MGQVVPVANTEDRLIQEYWDKYLNNSAFVSRRGFNCFACKKRQTSDKMRICFSCSERSGLFVVAEKLKECAPFIFCADCIIDLHLALGHRQEKLINYDESLQTIKVMTKTGLTMRSLLANDTLCEIEQSYKLLNSVVKMVLHPNVDQQCTDLSAVSDLLKKCVTFLKMQELTQRKIEAICKELKEVVKFELVAVPVQEQPRVQPHQVPNQQPSVQQVPYQQPVLGTTQQTSGMIHQQVPMAQQSAQHVQFQQQYVGSSSTSQVAPMRMSFLQQPAQHAPSYPTYNGATNMRQQVPQQSQHPQTYNGITQSQTGVQQYPYYSGVPQRQVAYNQPSVQQRQMPQQPQQQLHYGVVPVNRAAAPASNPGYNQLNQTTAYYPTLQQAPIQQQAIQPPQCQFPAQRCTCAVSYSRVSQGYQQPQPQQHPQQQQPEQQLQQQPQQQQTHQQPQQQPHQQPQQQPHQQPHQQPQQQVPTSALPSISTIPSDDIIARVKSMLNNTVQSHIADAAGPSMQFGTASDVAQNSDRTNVSGNTTSDSWRTTTAESTSHPQVVRLPIRNVSEEETEELEDSDVNDEDSEEEVEDEDSEEEVENEESGEDEEEGELELVDSEDNEESEVDMGEYTDDEEPSTEEEAGQQPVEEEMPMQKQLIVLLHAHKCLQRERECTLPHCDSIKRVLKHKYTCTSGWTCRFAHCSSSLDIIDHWKNCFDIDCLVCAPVRRIFTMPSTGGVDLRTVFDVYAVPKVPSADVVSVSAASMQTVSSVSPAKNSTVIASSDAPTDAVDTTSISFLDKKIEVNNVSKEDRVKNETVRVLFTQADGTVRSTTYVLSGVPPIRVFGRPPTTEVEWATIRSDRLQLAMLMHAHKCTDVYCGALRCRTMKLVLRHRQTCSNGWKCTHGLCASSGQIINHWANCENAHCLVCAPLRRVASDVTGLPSAALARIAEDIEKDEKSTNIC